HAEVAALAQLRKIPKSSTLFVTLEPCAHFGKMPPCADYLIKRGVCRVVVACKDPNPLVSGRGIRRLRRAGVQVDVGLLSEESNRLNRDYNYWIKSHKPYLTLKLAQSLDGKIATSTGQSKWISGPASRVLVQKLRLGTDAIIVGINTVLKDDPRLSARGGDENTNQPVKVILDAALRTPADARLFEKTRPTDVILVTSARATRRRRQLLGKQATLLELPLSRSGGFDWNKLLLELGRRGVVSALVEGGSATAAGALKAGVVREIYWFIAPTIIGGIDGLSAVGGLGVKRLSEAVKIRRMEYKKIGNDLLIHGVL
ncbi:MAG: bifunctional diaminohydroxyphosphoribosylaminopyrimidine deaminase/5-amino-6-(5-phosphoribosylamino)uracil reductase RibD, partial [Candidatus Omnitrophota bacterium]